MSGAREVTTTPDGGLVLSYLAGRRGTAGGQPRLATIAFDPATQAPIALLTASDTPAEGGPPVAPRSAADGRQVARCPRRARPVIQNRSMINEGTWAGPSSIVKAPARPASAASRGVSSFINTVQSGSPEVDGVADLLVQDDADGRVDRRIDPEPARAEEHASRGRSATRPRRGRTPSAARGCRAGSGRGEPAGVVDRPDVAPLRGDDATEPVEGRAVVGSPDGRGRGPRRASRPARP